MQTRGGAAWDHPDARTYGSRKNLAVLTIQIERVHQGKRAVVHQARPRVDAGFLFSSSSGHPATANPRRLTFFSILHSWWVVP
jgi:hypothetical protein